MIAVVFQRHFAVMGPTAWVADADPIGDYHQAFTINCELTS